MVLFWTKVFLPISRGPAPVEPSDYRRAGERGSAVTNRTSPTSALSNWPASPFIAGALAIIIFVIDTFTPLDIAIAVLYVIVVLMATNFLRRRGVIFVSLACAGLTVLSFILQHEWDTSDSIGRNLVSLTAIGVTAILALNRQRAEDGRRSETYLTEAQRLSRTGSFSWQIATEEQVWSEEIFRIYEYDFATKPTLDLVRRRSHPDDASMLEQPLNRR
jgi:two-component system sensor kinase FixL